MRIILVDDDPIVSSSLRAILHADGIDVVAIGQDGEDALALYEQHKPDIALFDIRMKVMNGIEAGKLILNEYPDAKIVFLTTFKDDEYVHQALEIGAKGYLLKQDFETITVALKSVLTGQFVFGGDIAQSLTSIRSKRIVNPSLSARDIELLEHIASGYNNKEISGQLGYSEGTIRNHVSALLEKLDLRDRTQLAIYYFNTIK